jgi:hypothetical protein
MTALAKAPARHKMRAGDGSPLYHQAQKRTLCSATAGKRCPAPSLSTEIAPLYQFQPSKKGAVAGCPSFLTLRDSGFQDKNGLTHRVFLTKAALRIIEETGKLCEE